MKRITALALTAALAAALLGAGCSKREDAPATTAPPSTTMEPTTPMAPASSASQ